MGLRDMFPDVPSEGDMTHLVSAAELAKGSEEEVTDETGEETSRRTLHKGSISKLISSGRFVAPRVITVDERGNERGFWHPNDVADHLRDMADEVHPTNKPKHYPARGGRAASRARQADAIESNLGVSEGSGGQAAPQRLDFSELLDALNDIEAAGPAPQPEVKEPKKDWRTGQYKLF